MTEPQYKEKIGTHVQLPVQSKIDEYIDFLEGEAHRLRRLIDNANIFPLITHGMHSGTISALEKAKQILK